MTFCKGIKIPCIATTLKLCVLWTSAKWSACPSFVMECCATGNSTTTSCDIPTGLVHHWIFKLVISDYTKPASKAFRTRCWLWRMFLPLTSQLIMTRQRTKYTHHITRWSMSCQEVYETDLSGYSPIKHKRQAVSHLGIRKFKSVAHKISNENFSLA